MSVPGTSRRCGALTSNALRPGYPTAALNSLHICGVRELSESWRSRLPRSGRLRFEDRFRREISGHTPRSPIAGFIVAEAGSRGAGHIITIDVLPEARKAGVGSQLLSSAEERLLRAGCTSVILETAVDNRAALAFYRTHEYRAMRTIPGYYSDGVDALVLKKDLLSPSGPAKLPQ